MIEGVKNMAGWMRKYREVCKKIWRLMCIMHRYAENCREFVMSLFRESELPYILFGIDIKDELYECYLKNNIHVLPQIYYPVGDDSLFVDMLFINRYYKYLIHELYSGDDAYSDIRAYVRSDAIYTHSIIDGLSSLSEEKILHPETWRCIYTKIFPKLNNDAVFFMASVMIPLMEYIRTHREEIEKTINNIELDVSKNLKISSIDNVVPPAHLISLENITQPLPFEIVFRYEEISAIKIYDAVSRHYILFEYEYMEENKIEFVEEDGPKHIELISHKGLTIGEALEKIYVPALENFTKATVFLAVKSDMRDKIKKFWHTAVSSFLRHMR